MSEGRIQTRAIRYARQRGCKAKRNYMGPGAEVGWPDVEIFAPGGKTILIEFKAPGERLRKIQAHRINELKRLGHSVYVCDNFTDAKAIIDAACAGS